MEIQKLINEKQRRCRNCTYCRKHYLYMADKAEIQGLSCDITNRSVQIIGKDNNAYNFLFKQCPLAEKKGEL